MTKTKKPSSISIDKIIIDTFESDLLSFSTKRTGHWSSRRFKQTGDPKYIEAVLSDFQKRTLFSYPYLLMLEDKKQIMAISKKVVEKYKETNDRRRLRKETFLKYPEVTFYTRVAAYLFFMQQFGVNKFKSLEPVYEKSVSLLKEVDWKKLLLDSGLVVSHPSAVANATFYLYYTGIADIREKTITAFKKYWVDLVCDRDEEYQLKIYAMTHLILADSGYYQHTPKADHKWILSFFKKNVNDIINRTNADIMCEVALSFCLLGKADDPIVLLLKTEVKKYFDPEIGFIPRELDRENKEAAEHRNILAVLLFGYHSKWHPGPDLYTYIREKKRSLYLPTTPLISIGSVSEEGDE